MNTAENVDRWADPPDHTRDCRCSLCLAPSSPLATALVPHGGRGTVWTPAELPPLFEALSVPSLCVRCETVMVEHPGICDACVRLAAGAQRRKAVAFARRTIPEGLRGRTLESCEAFAHPDALAAVQGLFGRALPQGLALVGESGACKTSLAVGMLTRIHDRAASVDAKERLFELGRAAFWVEADELRTECEERRFKSEVPPLLALARNARVLFLDEAHKGGDVAWSVVQRRFHRGQTTVITTWRSREETARTLGDGFARRVYERVIECPKRVTP